MNSTLLKRVLPLLISVSALAGCLPADDRSPSTGSQLDTAVQTTVNTSILPAVESMHSQTQALDAAAEQLCSGNNLTTDNLEQLQLQWQATNDAWYSLLPFNFGPTQVRDILVTPAFWYIDSFRPRGDDETAGVRDAISQLLTDQIEITDELFSSKSYTDVGLLPLELLIFETADETHSNTTNDILTEYFTNSRKCQILTGQTAELLRRITQIESGWNTDYRSTGQSYKSLLINKQLEAVLDDESSSDGFVKITVAVQEYFDYLGKRDVTIKVAQLSDSVWNAVSTSVDIVERMLEGDSSSFNGWFSLMSSNGADQDVETVRSNIEAIRSAIANQNGDELKTAASAIDGNFKREIPDSLNANLGINFSDGD